MWNKTDLKNVEHAIGRKKTEIEHVEHAIREPRTYLKTAKYLLEPLNSAYRSTSQRGTFTSKPELHRSKNKRNNQTVTSSNFCYSPFQKNPKM